MTTRIGKGKTNDLLKKFEQIVVVLEDEKHYMTLDSYRTIDRNLDEIILGIFGYDGQKKVQNALMEHIRKGKRA